MKHASQKWSTFFSLSVLVCLVSSCKKQQDDPKVKARVTAFSMRINGQEWRPYQDQADTCNVTFSGSAGGLVYNDERGYVPMYTFYAYRDPDGRRDAYSQNLLRLQLVNVKKPDTYPLDGSYKRDFDSYIMFQIRPQPTDESKRYTNDPRRRPFVVKVEDIPQQPYSGIPGIKATFEGVMYNEDDLSDSLVITNGIIRFKQLGDYHCGFE